MEFTDYDTRLAAYAVIVDDRDRVLLSWYRGSERLAPGWTLPGGGVEYDESLEDGVVREVHEETGYVVEVGAPLTTSSLTSDVGPRPPRPSKSLRVVFDATITGGRLGTIEVGGTTERAEWVPLDEVALHETRSSIIDLGIAAWRARREAGRG